MFHSAPVQANIASVLDDQGKPEEALALFHEALVIFEKDLCQDHPLMADTLYNIGNAYESQELFELAAENFEKCAAIYSKVHGENHSETFDARTRAKSARKD